MHTFATVRILSASSSASWIVVIVIVSRRIVPLRIAVFLTLTVRESLCQNAPDTRRARGGRVWCDCGCDSVLREYCEHRNVRDLENSRPKLPEESVLIISTFSFFYPSILFLSFPFSDLFSFQWIHKIVDSSLIDKIEATLQLLRKKEKSQLKKILDSRFS